jgi:quercetin dioxygenase-like cupin family protein
MPTPSQVRPGTPTHAALTHFRIPDVLGRLKQESTWLAGSRDAITLVKEPSLRVVLISAKRGTKLHEHEVPGPLTLQVVRGALRLKSSVDTIDARAGSLLFLGPGLAHEIEALEESDFLLTFVEKP